MSRVKLDKIFGVLILIGMLAAIINQINAVSHFEKNEKLASCTVSRIYNAGPKTGYRLYVDYIYVVNGKRIVGSSGYSRDKFCCWHNFIGKSFPVLYDSTAPSLSTIIIFPSDFDNRKLNLD